MKKKILLSILMIIIVLVLGLAIFKVVEMAFVKKENPVVEFEIKDYGNIQIELYPQKAPNTVKNFLALVKSGWYNGKIFYGKDINVLHIGRTQEGVELVPTLKDINQGGDEQYQIKGEFLDNGFANDLTHTKYALSMARSNYAQISEALAQKGYDSASSLFNIVMVDDKALDGKYAVFGKVIKGQEVCDKIFAQEQIFKQEQSVYDLNPFKNPPVIEKAFIVKGDDQIGKVKTEPKFDLQQYLMDIANRKMNKRG